MHVNTTCYFVVCLDIVAHFVWLAGLFSNSSDLTRLGIHLYIYIFFTSSFQRRFIPVLLFGNNSQLFQLVKQILPSSFHQSPHLDSFNSLSFWYLRRHLRVSEWVLDIHNIHRRSQGMIWPEAKPKAVYHPQWFCLENVPHTICEYTEGYWHRCICMSFVYGGGAEVQWFALLPHTQCGFEPLPLRVYKNCICQG